MHRSNPRQSRRANHKARKPSNRNLGKGQTVVLPIVSCTLSVDGAVLTLSFDFPVVVDGPIDLNPDGLTLVGQLQVDSMTWQLTYDDDLVGVHYDGIGYGDPTIVSTQGGAFAGIDAGIFA